MARQNYLGEFELMVLAAIMRHGDNAYGVIIRKEIETRAGRSVAIGALYATLGRMETKELVTSRMGGASPERGGRAKRFYKVTGAGQTQFEKSATALSAMLDGLFKWPRATLEPVQ